MTLKGFRIPAVQTPAVQPAAEANRADEPRVAGNQPEPSPNQPASNRPRLAFGNRLVGANQNPAAPTGAEFADDRDSAGDPVAGVLSDDGLGNLDDPVQSAKAAGGESLQPDSVPSAGAAESKPTGILATLAGKAGTQRVDAGGASPEPSNRPTGGLAALIGGVRATPIDLADRGVGLPESGSGEEGAFSLDDLNNFSGDAVLDPLQMYADMIPAGLPERPLPDDLTEQQLQFVELVESTYHVLNEPEAFGQVIRSLMAELNDNPEYDKMIVDADINAMMRGMRQTMGLAQIKKASKSRGAKKPTAKDSKLAVAAEDLDGMFGAGAFD